MTRLRQPVAAAADARPAPGRRSQWSAARAAPTAGLALAALLLAAAVPPASAQTAGAMAAPEGSLAERLVDAFEGTFGRHAGARRSGARGVCAAGEFVASGAAERYSTAATLRAGARSPVAARFSVGGGNPAAPENAPSVRGLSLSLDGPGGEAHEFVLVNTPVFTARTPESLLAFLRARAPDPATRAPDPARVAAANAAHPDWGPQMAYLRDTPPPASYATAPYFGVNSFVLVDASGARRHARWTFEPVAGRVGLAPEERAARGTAFLEAELRERLARSGPAEWRVLLVFPREGDPLDDATAAWPADRESVEAGRLRVASVGAAADCAERMFNPTLLPTGVEPSGDPVLAIRAESYAVSLSRRLP